MTPKDVIDQAGKDWRTELENKFIVARIRREEIDEIVMEKFISELISTYTKDLLQSVVEMVEEKRIYSEQGTEWVYKNDLTSSLSDIIQEIK